ncbi:endospore germination permease [Cytobacillus praedii]|uniref:endospore germination permease n=1 Tax=Cytobacillus praedii TaxID=1742358 RepID=UPI003AF61040
MQFSRIQLFFVLILFIGISNHVLILPHLLSSAKRDSWVCVIVAYFILLCWGYLIYRIMSRNSQRQKLYYWLQARSGKQISKFILTLLMLYIVSVGVISFYDLIQTVQIYFLPLSPSWLVMLPFLLLCVWTAYSGMKSIVYISTVLLPLVWLLGHFVAFSTMDAKDYSYIFPVLINGYDPIIKGTITILGGSVDLLVLLLLQHHLNKSYSFLYILILISILLGLVLGPTLGSIAAFGPSIAADMRFPAFELWRLITLGQHISHVDFLAVFQLLSGAIIRISLCLFLVSDVVETSSKKIKILIFILFSIILASVTIFPISDMWVQHFVGKYFYSSTVILALFISLILFIISYLPLRKGIINT